MAFLRSWGHGFGLGLSPRNVHDPATLMSARVVVIGSSNTDLVVRTVKLPEPGETVTGSSFAVHAGGKGANQAVAAARAGARVTFVACIRRDEFGDAAVARFVKAGIDTRWITRNSAKPSGVALILTDPKGENMIGVALGSNEDLGAKHVAAAATAIRDAGCVVAQLEVPLSAVRQAARLASGFGVPMLLNPAPAVRLDSELLACLTVLTPNRGELALLTGSSVRRKSDIARAALLLRRKGVSHTIVTCGVDGVCWCSDHSIQWFAAPRVVAVDSVGAGDCFSGALAAAMARGDSMPDAIQFAVTAAAICVTRHGAQSSMPWRREILARTLHGFSRKA
jgi:ribokinase